MQRIWRNISVIPILLVFGFVPLIVTAKKYVIGLSGYRWFSDLHTSVDLFLYWKGQGLILLAFLMLLFLIVSFGMKNQAPQLGQKLKAGMPAVVCMGIYLLLSLLSAIFSNYRDFALRGGYEQWEGLNVLAAYVVLLLYAYVAVNEEKTVRLVVYSILLGGFVLGLIGTFQYLRMDLFRNETGQAIMNLLSETKMKYTFNFSDGWVYATLYNPNYVGSYVALVLPVVVATAIIEWKKIPPFWTVLAMITTCLLTITLLGSQSLTGCVGVVAGLLFLAVYMWPRMISKLGGRKIIAGALCICVFAGAMLFLYPEEIRFGMDKLFRPKEDYHLVQSMSSTDRGLAVTTVRDDIFYVNVTEKESEPLEVTDAEGKRIALSYEKAKNYYTLEDDRFTNFRLYPTSVQAEGLFYPAVSIFNPTINKKWTVAKADARYMIYNSFKKLDELREIPAWGFADCQHFGDKRGYIWSRTFPLLKNSMLLGTGPNTFTMVFPNDDYVGKTNMNYDGVTVTKPHNMYLQIWVQTGFLSMVAFILIFILYFLDSLKLYFNRAEYGLMEKFGVAFMVAAFSYMVTGLANDSTVAVAPVYWGILGLGMATNRLVKIRQKFVN